MIRPLEMTDSERCDEIVRLRAEVERLRKCAEDQERLFNLAADKCDQYRVEAERLRAKNDRLREILDDVTSSIAEWQRLREEVGEVERLSGLTCASCATRETCEYVDDPYNTSGDCLADK